MRNQNFFSLGHVGSARALKRSGKRRDGIEKMGNHFKVWEKENEKWKKARVYRDHKRSAVAKREKGGGMKPCGGRVSTKNRRD